MIYVQSRHIRKKDIKEVLAFRTVLKDWDIITTDKHYTISCQIEEFNLDEMRDFCEDLSYTLTNTGSIILKVAGAENLSEVLSRAYVIEQGKMVSYDTFEYCIGTKELKIAK